MPGGDETGATARAESATRRFLFLQGPLSPLYRLVGKGLRAAGHGVLRVNFCAGDWWHWHGAGTQAYRGRIEDWGPHVARLIAREAITDLVLHGDTRPYHREAVAAAQAAGVAVHVTELGLLRPGFLTHEREGLGVLSLFPEAPEAIAALGAGFRAGIASPRFPGSFALEAWQDVSYHAVNLLLSPLFPHHRRHTPEHPLVDYAFWLRRLVMGRWRRRDVERLQHRLCNDGRGFFVLPLQVEGDYQIRAQSPFATVRESLRRVVRDFLDNAPRSARLVIKTHPLDNGAVDWRAFLKDLAAADVEARRIVLLDGGDLSRLLDHASGCVTVNSTAGLEALRQGCPVHVLAPALYDIAGMTDQRSLRDFWHEPQRPDGELVTAFVGALAATTQFPGSIHNRQGLEVAVEGLTARLLAPSVPRPSWCCAEPPRLQRARAAGVPL